MENGRGFSYVGFMTFAIRFAEPEDAAEILSDLVRLLRCVERFVRTVAPSRKQWWSASCTSRRTIPGWSLKPKVALAGYVYATRFRERAGYRWTTEVAGVVAQKTTRAESA